MTAALAFGETLAAGVVAVMYSGGTFLEGFAEGRARRPHGHVLAHRLAESVSVLRQHNSEAMRPRTPITSPVGFFPQFRLRIS
jgi:hypothetical protein